MSKREYTTLGESFPPCPKCETELTKKISRSEKNPDREFYVCERCTGKDGSGYFFAGWVDTFKSEPKRKVQKTFTSIKNPDDYSQPTSNQNLKQQLENIESTLQIISEKLDWIITRKDE